MSCGGGGVCSYWDKGACSLINNHDEVFLEEMLNNDVHVLARFLLKHDCKGDFKSMFQDKNKCRDD